MIKVITLLILIFSGLNPSCYAYAEESSPSFYYVINKAEVYSEPDSESLHLDTLNRNQEVICLEEISENGIIWIKIEADSDESAVCGYVEKELLYEKIGGLIVTIKNGWATTTGSGKKIELLNSPDIENMAGISVSDGTLLEIIYEAEDYTKVLYQGSVYYVKSQNITTGLTYYQRIALYIGVICVVTIILVLLLTYINNNVRKR